MSSITGRCRIADIADFDISPAELSDDFKDEAGIYICGENKQGGSFSFVYTDGLYLPAASEDMPHESERDTFYLHEVNVPKKSRGNGIGTAALLLAAEYASKHGMNYMRMGIVNLAVIKCLEKLDGCHPVGERRYLIKNVVPQLAVTTEDILASSETVSANEASSMIIESEKLINKYESGRIAIDDHRTVTFTADCVVSLL